MDVSSVFSISTNAIKNNLNELRANAQKIAEFNLKGSADANTPAATPNVSNQLFAANNPLKTYQQIDSIAAPLINNIALESATQASVATLKTASDALGTVINIRA